MINSMFWQDPLVEEVVSSLFETNCLPEPSQLMAQPDRHAELADMMEPLLGGSK